MGLIEEICGQAYNDDNTVEVEVLHQLDDAATGLKYRFIS